MSNHVTRVGVLVLDLRPLELIPAGALAHATTSHRDQRIQFSRLRTSGVKAPIEPGEKGTEGGPTSVIHPYIHNIAPVATRRNTGKYCVRPSGRPTSELDK